MVHSHSRMPKISDFEIFEDGYIFLCSAKNESQCLQNKVFGTYRSGWADVKKITNRTAIFLYAISRSPVVHGIFVARSRPFLSYRFYEHELPVQVKTTPFHNFDSLPSHMLNLAEIWGGSRGCSTQTLKSCSQISVKEHCGRYLTKQQTRKVIKAFLKHARADSPTPISVRAIHKSRPSQMKSINNRRMAKANGVHRGLKTIEPPKQSMLIMGPHSRLPGKPKGLIMGPHDPFKMVSSPVLASKKRKKQKRKEHVNDVVSSLKGRPHKLKPTKAIRHKINSTDNTVQKGSRNNALVKIKSKGRVRLNTQSRRNESANRKKPTSSPRKSENSRSKRTNDYDLCWDFIYGRCRRARCMWRHEMSANPHYKAPRWVKKSWKKTDNMHSKWKGRNQYLSLDE